MKYDKLFDLTSDRDIEKYMLRFLSMVPSFKFKAEPGGMKAAILLPTEEKNIDFFDLVDVSEWAYFIRPQNFNMENVLLEYYSNRFMPVIGNKYSGKLLPYFKEIKKLVPNWNGLIPATVYYGTYDTSIESYNEIFEKCYEDNLHLQKIKAEAGKKVSDALKQQQSQQQGHLDILGTFKKDPFNVN